MSVLKRPQPPQHPSPPPKIYSYEEIEAITSTPSFDADLIDAIAHGLAEFSSGKFNICPIQTLGAPPMARFVGDDDKNGDDDNDGNDGNGNDDYAAQVCVKSGYLTGDPHFVIKVASGGSPLPENTGLMQVYSQRTGRLEALLLDEGLLTELRTAAAGAVAAKYILMGRGSGGRRKNKIKRIGMIGTGVQARFQLRYLKQVVLMADDDDDDDCCCEVFIYGRSPEKAESLKKELESESLSSSSEEKGEARNCRWSLVTVVNDPQELFKQSCDLIVTTTYAREAVLFSPPPSSSSSSSSSPFSIIKKRPLLINCIGADSPGKMELSSDLVAQADALVCDSRLQTQERGEFQHAIRESKVKLEDISELGEVILSSSLSSTSAVNVVAQQNGEDVDEKHDNDDNDTSKSFTIFDSSGVAVQDCVVAKMVYQALLKAETIC